MDNIRSSMDNLRSSINNCQHISAKLKSLQDLNISSTQDLEFLLNELKSIQDVDLFSPSINFSSHINHKELHEEDEDSNTTNITDQILKGNQDLVNSFNDIHISTLSVYDYISEAKETEASLYITALQTSKDTSFNILKEANDHTNSIQSFFEQCDKF